MSVVIEIEIFAVCSNDIEEKVVISRNDDNPSLQSANGSLNLIVLLDVSWLS